MKKITKIKWVAFSMLMLSFTVFGVIFLLMRDVGSPNGFKSSSKIDTYIFSNNASSNSKLPKNETANIFISRNNQNQNKNFNSLYPISQNFILYPYSETEISKILTDSKIDGIKSFNNFDFEIKKIFRGENIIQIKYDSVQEKLIFVIPSIQLNINGKKYTSKEILVYSLDNIAPDSFIKIDENNVYKVSNNLKIEVTIGDLKNMKIKIYKSTGKNLLDPKIASFENGLWQKEAGDCSNKLPGKSNLLLSASKDATIGKISANLFSTNHYACISKTFPIGMNNDKLYQLLFDFKNITGKNIRYYYKLKGDAYNEKEGYAFAETVPAENHEWNTYSTIINPETFRKNFITPEYSRTQANNGGSLANTLNVGISELLLGDPIKKIKYIDIFFYAPSDGTREISNLYDNVQLKEYKLSESRIINFESIIDKDISFVEKITLKSEENTFDYFVDNKNLLNSDMASFENGLWQHEADDCSNTMKGKSSIKLSESSDAKDGLISAKLSSKNHFACISKTFPVSIGNGELYKLQFDYKNLEGSKVMYYYNLRSDQEQESNSDTIETTDKDWHTYETIINPEISYVKYIDIYFYAPSNGTKEITDLYDNVHLTKWLPKDLSSYYLYVKQNIDNSPKLKTVEFKAVNMWKNKVVLHGVKDSFLLIYPEEYSGKWKAFPVQSQNSTILLQNTGNILKNYFVPEIESNRQATKDEISGFITNNLISAVGKDFISKNFDGSIRNDNLPSGWFWDTWGKRTIPEDIHYQINNYGNSWWIDVNELCKQQNLCIQNKDGTYEISLIVEYSYYKNLIIDLLISGITLASCLSYLTFAGIRGFRHRRRGKQKNEREMGYIQEEVQ